MRRSFALALITSFGLTSSAWAALGVPDPSEEAVSAVDLEPSPHLNPHQVVEVQLGGLAANREWGEDRGIGLAFRFASPANQRMTGPFPRFARMVNSGAYAALVDHRASQIGPIQMHHGSAMLPVLIQDAEGRDRAFVWVLSRQTEGRWRDCWMTDAVYPATPSAVEAEGAKSTDI